MLMSPRIITQINAKFRTRTPEEIIRNYNLSLLFGFVYKFYAIISNIHKI